MCSVFWVPSPAQHKNRKRDGRPGWVFVGRSRESKRQGPLCRSQHEGGRHAYPEHLLGPCFGSKHGEDPCATPDIQHHFVLEHVLIMVHGVPVREGPHLILQHFLQWKEKKVIVGGLRASGSTSGSLEHICITGN